MKLPMWLCPYRLSTPPQSLSPLPPCSLCLVACGDDASKPMADGADVIRKRVFCLLDDLHRYLHHKRPYARHFYLPYWTSPESSAPGQEILVRGTIKEVDAD